MHVNNLNGNKGLGGVETHLLKEPIRKEVCENCLDILVASC